MSKIAIISQPDQGVLIDVGGCTTMQEAVEHLSSTLQVSSQFWNGVSVALNLGQLKLTNQQVAHILALAKGVGVIPHQVFSTDDGTKKALQDLNVSIGEGVPMSLPSITFAEEAEDYEAEAEEPVAGDIASPDPDLSGVYETQDTRDFEHDVLQGEALQHVEEFAAAKAATATSTQTLPAVMYLRQTLRSGQTVSHKGHLIVIGDVNPGAEIMAEGDITVWGALRGIAHAGIGGNVGAEIRALRLQPIQIRIAHAIARSPDRPRIHYPNNAGPEIARVIDGKIKVSRFNAE